MRWPRCGCIDRWWVCCFVFAQEKHTSLHADLRDLGKRAERRRTQLAQAKQKWERAKARFEALPATDELEARVAAAREAAGPAEQQLDQAESSKASANRSLRSSEPAIRQIEHRLTQLRNSRQQKLNKLRRVPGGDMALRVAMWVSQNSNRFRDKVFGPLIAEMEVTEPRFAAVVEAAVPKTVQLAFVVCNSNDRDV